MLIALKLQQTLEEFRLNELQQVITVARGDKYGRKLELFQRILLLLEHPNPNQQMLLKIREIAK